MHALGSRIVTAVLIASLLPLPGALAHEDPPDCGDNDTYIAITVLRSDDSVVGYGSVSECETIRYRARLLKGVDADYVCAFSGGTFKLTTPDGVVHDLTLNVPCIGGTTGGCSSAVDFFDGPLISYTVRPSDILNGGVAASADYSGGTLHDASHTQTGASASVQTPVVLCNDAKLCTIDTCDPSGKGSAACLNTPLDCNDSSACTIDSCDQLTAICLHIPIQCGDPDPCTVDSCNPASGCVHTPVVCNDGNPCTLDLCSLGFCAFPFANSGVVCRPSAGVCDVAESCTGASPFCPGNVFANGIACRSSAGICDVAEICPGTGAACPGNSFAGTGKVCRPAADQCDRQEVCSGTTSSCPADSSQCVTTTTMPGPLCGDANEDGMVSAGDALIALRTGVGTDECDLSLCDYDGTGEVSAADALAILRTAVGQVVPPKCP